MLWRQRPFWQQGGQGLSTLGARTSAVAALLLVLVGMAAVLHAEEKPRYAGPSEQGFLLPNGWTISPAGEQVPLTDLPLNIVPLSDSRRALVGSSGYNNHELVLVDLGTKQKLATQSVRQSWFGLALAQRRTASGGRAGAAIKCTRSTSAKISSPASARMKPTSKSRAN